MAYTDTVNSLNETLTHSLTHSLAGRFTVKGSQWEAAHVRAAVWVRPWVGGEGSQQ